MAKFNSIDLHNLSSGDIQEAHAVKDCFLNSFSKNVDPELYKRKHFKIFKKKK